MRRLAPAIALVLLAGCAAPPDDKAEDPLLGLCPQWAQGNGAQSAGLQLAGNGTESRELGPADARYLGRPLDMFRVHIDALETNGTVRLRATDANGDRLSLRDHRLGDIQIVPVAVLQGDAKGHDFDVFLSPVLEEAPQAPMPARLEWTLDNGVAKVDYTVTYHYKVCGS